MLLRDACLAKKGKTLASVSRISICYKLLLFNWYKISLKYVASLYSWFGTPGFKI